MLPGGTASGPERRIRQLAEIALRNGGTALIGGSKLVNCTSASAA